MLRRFFSTRRTRLKLERLDDRLLKDIGIHRSEIERISRLPVPAPLSRRERSGRHHA
mgnify:CR=1 FL=1